MTQGAERTRAIIVMGVSGSGKSTIGAALAQSLGWDFADADDYHPASNTAKMSRGEALTDADRQPWLETLHQLLAQHIQGERSIVLACSALKQSYRDILMQDLDDAALVFASGSPELITKRMQARQHFMPPSLLESQLATLEAPTAQEAITVDIRKPINELVEEIKSQLIDNKHG